MKFKIKIIITIMVSFVVIVSMCFFIVNRNSISISGFNSDTVITGSNNSYLITLKGVPSGNETYQQLITINNYSKYGINDNGSNIEFFDYSNYTHLYAWIQSINTTLMQVWIKNYNDSLIIDMCVLSSFENLFSLNGHLGISTIPSENNVQKVFPNSWNFVENQTVFGLNVSAISYSFSNSGLTISESSYGGGVALITNSSYSNKSIAISGFISSDSSGGLTWASSPFLSSRYNASSQTEVYSYDTTFLTQLIAYVSGKRYNINLNLFSDVNTYGTYMESVSGKSVEAFFNSSYEIQNTTNIFTNMHYGVIEWYNRISVISYLAIGNVPLQLMPAFTIVLLYHSIDFKLLGSPFSSLWNIMVNGTTYQADSSNIYLNMTNGYYNIIVNLPAGYSAITKGVLYVNGTNQVYKIFVSYNNNSGISNDIIYAIILASIIVAAAIYFSKRS